MEGLWSVAFATGAGTSYGVVVFSEDRIVGGNGAFYWVGIYSEKSGRMELKIDAMSHSGLPSYTVLGNADRFSVEFAGPGPRSQAVGTSFTLTGPQGVTALLTRRV